MNEGSLEGAIRPPPPPPEKIIQKKRDGRKGPRLAEVAGLVEGDLGNAVETRQGPEFIAAMHRVGPGGEGFAMLATIRRAAGFLAVDDIAGDGQD
jgi:hypothetical protein